GKASSFEDTNLLPAAVRRRKQGVDLTFAWHTLLVAVLLFLSVLYFVYLFVAQQDRIADAERRLAEFPAEATMTAPELQ
ncbi:hypothetical protein JMU72_14745, partial [Mammaliicoccus sciuri]|uniref:hypothetical protein n=1 Tax=Mammaliicoccus sciuri TaxID=1296 RepID=UPI001F0FABFA